MLRVILLAAAFLSNQLAAWKEYRNMGGMTEEFHEVQINVNGKDYARTIESRLLLTDFIRHELELTGTHVGCEHGVCGACTIVFNGRIVRSCLMFAVQADGAKLETIEALANNGELHPIQQAFWEKHGLQCGYCTPGIIMTMKVFLEKNSSPSENEIRNALSGNLCRCTGYQQIVESVQHAVDLIKETHK